MSNYLDTGCRPGLSQTHLYASVVVVALGVVWYPLSLMAVWAATLASLGDFVRAALGDYSIYLMLGLCKSLFSKWLVSRILILCGRVWVVPPWVSDWLVRSAMLEPPASPQDNAKTDRGAVSLSLSLSLSPPFWYPYLKEHP